ncbi:MAG: hypothetical protein IJP82_08735 [Bacteroidaceae bacterium]|nr:hypothetical protein [Bacteroidaceae bacterium]
MKLKLQYIYLLLFVIAAYCLLPMTNSDYLYAIQDNNVFISGHTFMVDTVTNEGGWLVWVACYLTQFLYYPWLGSSLLIAMWTLIYLMTIHLFCLKDKSSPLALILPGILLFNLLDYGYWIYAAKTPGYPFQPTLVALFILLCSVLAHPLLKHSKYGSHLGKALPVTLCCLFCALCCILIWKPQRRNILNNHHCSILTTLTDKNFKHELRMYRAIDESNYEEVLAEWKKVKTAPTNLMVMFKNIALMHTGRLTDMFKTNNCGQKPETSDTLQERISQLAAPLIYYQFGQINYAYRWAMENSVKYGQSFRNLKMMAQCAIFNGEFDVAMKYLTLLNTSTFHKNWAREHEAWIMNSTRFIQSQDFQKIAPLINDDVNMLDNDEGDCKQYILNHFANLLHAATPQLEEVIMCLSLWTEDEYAFCVHFYDYVQKHPNEAIPQLYQQGAILLGTTESSPITLDKFRFDAVVSERYNQFAQDFNQLTRQGMDAKEMAKRLKPQYGDTYWWYYYFTNY